MTISRAIRLLLGIFTLGVVAWSFVDVGRRAWQQHRSDQSRPITLTILHWGDKTESTIVEELKLRYESAHPNVQIKRIATPDSAALQAKLKTMISAGTPPDLYYMPPELLPDAARMKLARPIDDYVAREVAKPGGQAWLDDFFPQLIQAYRYDTATEKIGEGPLYGIAKDFATAGFYINCDLFDKAGVDWRKYQKNGWTWDEFEVAARKIRDLSGTPGFENRQIYGGAFEIWHDTILNIVWSYGGEFFGPGGFTDIVLDQPAAQEALEMIVRTCRRDKTIYLPSGIAKETYQEFFAGNVAMDGPIGQWRVPRFKEITAFKWDILPVPYKAKQFQVSMLFHDAWAMSPGAAHPDEAFDLMKFMTGGEGATLQAKLGLAIPPQKSIAYSGAFLDRPEAPNLHEQVFLDATPYMRFVKAPSDPEWRPLLEDQVKRSIQLDEVTPAQSAQLVKEKWHQFLNAPLRRNKWQPMHWTPILWAIGLASLALLAALVWRARRERLGPLDRATERTGYLFILPWLVGFIALTLGPMLVSLLLSFTQWGALNPINESLSVGLANYQQLFTADPKFYLSLKITLYFVALAVPVTQAAALGVAILMNVRVKGIAVFRTIFFVPSLIIASVVGAVLWMQMYNNQYGIVNSILRGLHLYAPDWFGTDARYWAVPAFVLMTAWGVGSAMILYLAGLKGIPTSLYEAATIDGASRLTQFRNVTLPMLSPLIFYNVIMGIIGSFQFFIPPMVMTKGGPNDLTLFYLLNLYRQAFEFHNMGYASAMAWVLFLLLLGLTLVIFRGTRNVVYYEGLKQ